MLEDVTSQKPAGSPDEESGTATHRSMQDPFASETVGGIEYQTMVWWQAGMVMIAETISLGILSLPNTLSVLGIIPGLILLVGLGVMASYSGYVIGQLKNTYPHLHSMADAGGLLFGKYGQEILGFGQLLFYIFIMGSHILTFALTMNTITDHKICTVIYMAVGLVLSLLFTLPRTLRNLSYYSVASFISIIAAVFVTMIGLSVTKPGRKLDPFSGAWVQNVRLFPDPETEFYQAVLAVTNMAFAYAGHVAFFTFISELKNPHDFPKALALLQTSDISMYIICTVVIYYYAGNNVKSPALSSTGPLLSKVAFGVAIPTVIIAGVVNGHVAAKYVYVRLLRNSKEDVMHQRSFKSIGLWVAICTILWVVAWIIAETIPVFNDLLGITGALFATWFTFGLSGMFWFYLAFEKRSNEKWWWLKGKFAPKSGWTVKTIVLVVANFLNIMAALVLCMVGLYASFKSIVHNSHTQKPFSC